MMARRAAAETLGTFFLVFIGTGTIMANDQLQGAIGPLGIALAFGLVVMGMVYATGPVSGAHLNPAVTLGLWSAGRFPASLVPAYVIAQLVGASSASAFLALIRTRLSGAPSLGVTTSHVGVAFGLSIEFLLTFALMFVIMAMVTDARAPTGLAGLAIGVTVAFDALMGGALTGASMNPARSFGPALITGEWDHHWIYWLAPIAGALVAVQTCGWLYGTIATQSASDGDGLSHIGG